MSEWSLPWMVPVHHSHRTGIITQQVTENGRYLWKSRSHISKSPPGHILILPNCKCRTSKAIAIATDTGNPRLPHHRCLSGTALAAPSLRLPSWYASPLIQLWYATPPPLRPLNCKLHAPALLLIGPLWLFAFLSLSARVFEAGGCILWGFDAGERVWWGQLRVNCGLWSKRAFEGNVIQWRFSEESWLPSWYESPHIQLGYAPPPLDALKSKPHSFILLLIGPLWFAFLFLSACVFEAGGCSLCCSVVHSQKLLHCCPCCQCCTLIGSLLPKLLECFYWNINIKDFMRNLQKCPRSKG